MSKLLIDDIHIIYCLLSIFLEILNVPILRTNQKLQSIINPIFNCFEVTIMVKSIAKTKRTSPYTFRIIGNSHTYIKNEVQVSFRPLNKKKNIRNTCILPTFNTDRKHYTSTFIIPHLQPENDQQSKMDHERRVRQSLFEIQQILYPKPRSKHKYCNVCKDFYEDYKEHVEQQDHLQILRRSTFQKLIISQADKIALQISHQKQQEEKLQESTTEDQIFKCLNLQTVSKRQQQLIQ